MTIPKETDIVEKEELPDAAPVAVADRARPAATAGKTRGRKPGEHFAAAYANDLRASAKAAAAKAAAGCGANDAPTKAVEAVFKAVKVGDDVFAAVNDVSKANKTRRNAGLKDIALRICDAFLAARAGAGITTLYPPRTHLGNNDDKPLLQKVEELVWTRHVAPRVQKNKDKVRAELKPPTRNGYQLEIRENVIQADDNDDEEDVPIARRARAARAARSTVPADAADADEDDDDSNASSASSSDDDDDDDDDEPKPKRQRGRRASITAASTRTPRAPPPPRGRRRRRRALRRVVSASRSRYRRNPGVCAGRGVQTGAVTLRLVRRPATADGEGAVDAAAMGRFRACDGCATSLAWTGDVRLGESPGVSHRRGFALVVAARTDPFERSPPRANPSSPPRTPMDDGEGERPAQFPSSPARSCLRRMGTPVTRIAVADSVKIDSDKRAHARPVIAAGKASGTVAAWRLARTTPRPRRRRGAPGVTSSRCPGWRGAAAPRLNSAPRSGSSRCTPPAPPSRTPCPRTRAGHDDWTLTEACVEDLTVASTGLDLSGRAAAAAAALSSVSSHAGLAASPAGVLVATAAGFVSSTYATGATMIQSRARRGRVAVAPPAALAAARVKSATTEISGAAAAGKLDDGAADESLSVACAARRLPFLAPDRGVSLWDVRAAAKHAGAGGARALESAAGEMQSAGGTRASQLAKSLLSGGPEKFEGLSRCRAKGAGEGTPRGYVAGLRGLRPAAPGRPRAALSRRDLSVRHDDGTARRVIRPM